LKKRIGSRVVDKTDKHTNTQTHKHTNTPEIVKLFWVSNLTSQIFKNVARM